MGRKRLFGWIVFAIIVIGGIGIFVFYLISAQKSAQLPEIQVKVPTPTPLASANISVLSPQANQSIGRNFLISGKARVFENVVSVRLKNAQTPSIYLQTTVMAKAKESGEYGGFFLNVHLPDIPGLKTGTKLILEVYQLSAKDGRQIDKVSVPLKYFVMPK